MTTYYKATRPDGTSFHDPTTRWEVGKVTRLNGGELPYLSVSMVPTDCTGFSWPCRLFEVRPLRGHKVTTPSDDLPNKRGSDAWRVVREFPAHEVFGPQGAHVVALLERVEALTPDEAKRLSAARYAAGYAAVVAAGYAAGYAARYAARYAAGYAAWDAAGYAAGDAAVVAAGYAAVVAAGYAAGYAAGDAAGYAAGDAALALMSRDLIGDVFTQAHYDTLTLPWRTVIGRIHPDDAEPKGDGR